VPSVPWVDDDVVLVRALARRLVARLEENGWVHFQYRAGLGEMALRPGWTTPRRRTEGGAPPCR
jgi:hypothetical protein